MHLKGVARRWYQVYAIGRSYVDWNDFSIHFSTRFGALEQKLLYENFKQLKEPQSLMKTEKEEIEDYQEHPRYDEVPVEGKEDWHSDEFISTVLGLEPEYKDKIFKNLMMRLTKFSVRLMNSILVWR